MKTWHNYAKVEHSRKSKLAKATPVLLKNNNSNFSAMNFERRGLILGSVLRVGQKWHLVFYEIDRVLWEWPERPVRKVTPVAIFLTCDTRRDRNRNVKINVRTARGQKKKKKVSKNIDKSTKTNSELVSVKWKCKLKLFLKYFVWGVLFLGLRFPKLKSETVQR